MNKTYLYNALSITFDIGDTSCRWTVENGSSCCVVLLAFTEGTSVSRENGENHKCSTFCNVKSETAQIFH